VDFNTRMKITAIIIDDEKLARDLIASFLKNHKDIEVVSVCANGFDGLKAIQKQKPDLIFLDIKMPKITGFEMLELLDDPPVVIFSTAYDEFAIKAFEKNAVDYLLKPYSQERFDSAMNKAKERVQSGEKQQEEIQKAQESVQVEQLDRVVVKVGSKIHIIAISKIIHIEAMDDYVQIHTVEGKYLKQQTMKFFEAHLPPDDFVRIHRSNIAAVQQISKIEQMEKESYVAILKDGATLPVSRAGYAKLKGTLGF